jgi:polysaccharide deacetylase 2 family uncharacterized protein YibQ
MFDGAAFEVTGVGVGNAAESTLAAVQSHHNQSGCSGVEIIRVSHLFSNRLDHIVVAQR